MTERGRDPATVMEDPGPFATGPWKLADKVSREGKRPGDCYGGSRTFGNWAMEAGGQGQQGRGGGVEGRGAGDASSFTLGGVGRAGGCGHLRCLLGRRVGRRLRAPAGTGLPRGQPCAGEAG